MTRTPDAPQLDPLDGQSWAYVADSPFLPPRDGLHRETVGLLTVAREEGVLGLLVLPTDRPVDVTEYENTFGTPVVTTPRRTSPALLLHPTVPYVVASRPAPRWLARRAADAAPSLTGVVVGAYKSRAIGEALATALHLPAVMRQQNRESLYHATIAADMPALRGAVYRWEARRIARDEERLARANWLVGTADISMADARWRSRNHTHEVAHVPTFAVDPTAQPPTSRRPTVPPRVLFVGSLNTPTNQSALIWFTERVWGRVLVRRPDAVLSVVGSRPPEALRRQLRELSRVELHADVADVAPHLETATVAVNPAVAGSGVNIKLVEYMAAGIPVVSTYFAVGGLGLRPKQDLLIENEPAGFAEAVVDVLDDPEWAGGLAREGRRHLLSLLDSRANLETIGRLLRTRAEE